MSNTPDDEINLQELAVNIIQYFNQHFRFILASTILGIILGLLGFFFLPKSYESQMIIQSDILRESITGELTTSLNKLIKEHNLEILARRLELTEGEVEDLRAIEIESVLEKTKSTKDESPTFIITVEVADRALLSKLQESLIKYLRNNEFVKTRVQQRERTFQLLISKLGQEIRSLDSLKKRLFQGEPIYAKSSEMMLVDPTSIYSKIIELNKQQIDYKNNLELFNSIQLIEGFTPFNKPASPKLSTMLVAGFMLGFFGSVGVLIFNKLWKIARTVN